MRLFTASPLVPPTSTADCAMGGGRNRSTKPCLMSWAMPTPVFDAVSHRPGQDPDDHELAVVRAVHGDRAAEDGSEEQSERDGRRVGEQHDVRIMQVLEEIMFGECETVTDGLAEDAHLTCSCSFGLALTVPTAWPRSSDDDRRREVLDGVRVRPPVFRSWLRMSQLRVPFSADVVTVGDACLVRPAAGRQRFGKEGARVAGRRNGHGIFLRHDSRR
ncbi:hypothetical protein [Streptosporangium canum]|uniref:hypothetical protein n=1 Tax=Streptosporangium canum TaxID=324952 RepID=UPI0033B5E70E